MIAISSCVLSSGWFPGEYHTYVCVLPSVGRHILPWGRLELIYCPDFGWGQGWGFPGL